MADAFERIKSSVNLGIKGIGNKTSNMFGKATLKMDIETILRGIEKDYTALGEAMYKTWAARESLASLQDRLVAIQKKFSQIAELEKQIAAIEEQASQSVSQQMGVPEAPAAPVAQPVSPAAEPAVAPAPAAEPVIAPAPAAPQAVLFCKSCGSKCAEGAIFCRECGQKLY